MPTDLDESVRTTLYQRFVDDGTPPASEDIAEALGVSPAEAGEALERLHEAHVIVLQPGTRTLWMAAPLSAEPTPFRVKTAGSEFWGNCVWDGLGVIAMLGGDGTVETRCADCDEAMTLRVEGGELVEGDGVAHFAVPAAHWWDDIGFT